MIYPFNTDELRREVEEYQEWAREKDREQFQNYIKWLKENRQYIKKEPCHD